MLLVSLLPLPKPAVFVALALTSSANVLHFSIEDGILLGILLGLFVLRIVVGARGHGLCGRLEVTDRRRRDSSRQS